MKECGPWDMLAIFSAALPLVLTLAVPSTVVPSRNATRPSGVTPPPEGVVIFAVRVNVDPRIAGLLLAVKTTAVASATC